ncbi:MAG: glycosyltransferase family protein [Phycisphaerae bacterium]|nr:glycosyltransferase family protein [Phycisphaerae bacterium]MDD5381682.1 glycosyltransferase family protein [Phycisphaerae bacterium]
MKIGAVVQARTSSTRLPGKVLKDLPYGSEISVLQQVIRRLKKTSKLDDVVIATTMDKADMAIVELSEKENVRWFKGSIDDVLERYYLAAKENDLDIVVRITSDCPCIDPAVVDLVVERHIASKNDYTSNVLHRTFPHGLDTEVFNFGALEKAHGGAKKLSEREHVTSYIYSNPQLFNLGEVQAEKAFYSSDIRVTLDTAEDYVLLCAVFDYLYQADEFFGVEDIIKLFCDKPWLKDINKNVIQKRIFDSVEQEIKEAIRILDFQGLRRAKEILAGHMQ